MKKAPLVPRLLAALAHGKTYAAADLVEITGATHESVSSSLRRLLHCDRIIVVARAREVGRADLRGQTRLYGLPGTTPPAPEKSRPHTPADEIRVAQTITVGRGSFWGAGLA